MFCGQIRRMGMAAAAVSAAAILLMGSAAMAAAPKRLFIILMENHGTEQILNNPQDAPYLSDLIRQPGVHYATHYSGVTHPSLPNYLALLSGDTQGIRDDCKAGTEASCKPDEFVADDSEPLSLGQLFTDAHVVSVADHQAHLFKAINLVDQLEDKGHSWKAYMQAMPADNKTLEYAPVRKDGKVIAELYAQKHNPFMYFSDIRNNPKRVDNIVPYDQFISDLAANMLPDLVWISPDECHDMHGITARGAAAINMPDCGYPDSGLDHGAIKLGDAFLKYTVTAITRSKAWDEGAAIVIVFDEDDSTKPLATTGRSVGRINTTLEGAHTPLVVITASTVPARKFDEPANHYNLLAVIESEWNLGCLKNSCNVQKANTLSGILD